MPQAELYDGTILDFEEGTPDDVIAKVARQQTERLRTEEARTPLPQGVKPSQAGGGRGLVQPPAEPVPEQVAPAAQAPKKPLSIGGRGTAPTRAPVVADAPAGGSGESLPGLGEFGTGEQPQEQVAQAATAEPGAPFQPITEGAKGLKSGYIGLKQMANAVGIQADAATVASTARRLAVFDRIDRGDMEGVSPALGLTYAEADEAGRARIRRNAEKVIAQSRDTINLGMEAFRQYQEEQAQQKGQTDEFTDINSPAAFGNWLTKNGMAGLVSMAPLLVAGAATGGTGAAVLGAGMGVGETVGRRIDNLDQRLSPRRFDNISPDRRDDAIAAQNEAVQQRLADTAGANLGIGAVSGALDVVAGPVRGVVSGALRKAVAEGTKKLTAQGVAKEVAKDIAEEATTGALQEVVQIGGDVALGDREKFATMQTAKDVLNAAAAEGAGGAMGGAARVAHQAAASAYDRARAAGFNVEPPLATDTPRVQRTKTAAIFDDLAAQYGIPPGAVSRAKTTAESMPLNKVAGFYAKFVTALQSRGLVGAPVDAHALEALVAGPVTAPEDTKIAGAETKPSKSETAVSNIETILGGGGTEAAKTETAAAEPDYSGLSEPADQAPAPPAEVPAPGPADKDSEAKDLVTGDGQPYGTKAGAAARATREGGGEVVEVAGGWVVRTETASQPQAEEEAPPTGRPAVPSAAAPAPSGQAPDAVGAGGVGTGAVAPRVIARVGITPKQALPLELRENPDGTSTPWLEGHELLDYDSGEPVRVPAGASAEEALAAVKAARALGPRQKFFTAESAKPTTTTEAKEQPANAAAAAPAPAAEAAPVEAPAPAASRPAADQGVPGAAATGVQAAGVAPASKKKYRSRALDPASDTLLQALAKLGGVQRHGMASEFGLRPEELKHTVAVAGLKGYPFRAKGGMSVDAAIAAVREAGYLTGVSDADARKAFEDAVHQGIAGGQALTPQGQMAAAEAEAKVRADAAEEIDEDALAERAAIMAEAGLSEAEMSAIDDDDIDAAGTSNTSASEFMRAMGFTEEEIRDEQVQQRQQARGVREEVVPTEPGPARAATAVGSAEARPAAAPARKGLTDAQAFEQDYAAFAGKTVEQQVQVGDSGTAVLKMDAAKALRALDKRSEALQALKACLEAA